MMEGPFLNSDHPQNTAVNDMMGNGEYIDWFEMN